MSEKNSGKKFSCVCVFIPSPRREGSHFLRSTGPLNRGFNLFTKLITSRGVVRTQTWGAALTGYHFALTVARLARKQTNNPGKDVKVKSRNIKILTFQTLRKQQVWTIYILDTCAANSYKCPIISQVWDYI